MTYQRAYICTLTILITLLLVLVSSTVDADEATPPPEVISCTNAEEAVVYPDHTLTTEGAFRVPAGVIAYIDILMRTTQGPALVSGIVTRGSKKLTGKDGDDRWFMRLEEWECSYGAPKEEYKQEV